MRSLLALQRSRRTVSTVRLVLAALKDRDIAARTADSREGIPDPDILRLLQGMVKQRRESVEQFTKGGRKDLADKETKEIGIIEGYLPVAPSDAEIQRAVEDAIAAEGADSLKQMGAVVKAARARLEGKNVDGKVLSDKVRERLTPKS